MAIALVSGQYANNKGNGVTSLTLTLPTDATEDNLLVAILVVGQQASCNPPAGWSTAFDVSSETVARPETYCFYRIAPATPGAAFQFDHSGTGDMGGVIAEFSGIDTSTPFDTTGTYNSGATAVSAGTATSATTDTADELIIHGLGLTLNTVTNIALGTYTYLDEGHGGTGFDAVAAMGYGIVTSTGTYGGQWTWTTATQATAGVATFRASVVSTIELAGTIAGTSTTSTGLPAEPDTETNGTSTVFGDADTIVYIDAHTVPAPD